MKFIPLAAAAALAFGVSTQRFSCFPRMRETPSIKPFERRMPDMPAGLEPFGAAARPATREAAAALPNPIPDTPQARELGRIYYGYYCATCHGDEGGGDGAVGVSYVPKPADLTTRAVQAMPDGELAFAMAAGAGHDPVLDPTVPWERRWYIARFLRALTKHSPPGPADASGGRGGEMPKSRIGSQKPEPES